MGGESALIFSAIVQIETVVILQFSTVCTKESSGRRMDFCFQCNSPKWNCSYIAALDCFAQKKAVEWESALVFSTIVWFETALIFQLSTVLCTKEFTGMRIGSCFQWNRLNWKNSWIAAFHCFALKQWKENRLLFSVQSSELKQHLFCSFRLCFALNSLEWESALVFSGIVWIETAVKLQLSTVLH